MVKHSREFHESKKRLSQTRMYKRLSGAFVKTDRGVFCCWPRYIVALCMHRVSKVGMVTTNIKRNRICISCPGGIILATF